MVYRVTHSPPTCEVCGSNPEPYGGKLVFAHQFPAVYSAESIPIVLYWFLLSLKLTIVIYSIQCTEKKQR